MTVRWLERKRLEVLRKEEGLVAGVEESEN